MPTRSTVRRALSAAVPLLFCACATAAPIRVPVMHPGEIDMTPYRSVAVGELRGKADRVLTEGLEEALVATNHFQVIGPSRTASALGELQLSVADLSDPARAAKLGKALGASALIYGDADESYREEFSEDRLKEKDGAPTIIQKLFGELTVRATFRIVDGSTGRLVVTRTYGPQPIDKQQLARSARAAVVERFLRAVVPYQEFVTADFRKDGDLPQLESGIGFAERGEWKKAQDSFRAAAAQVEKNPDPDRKKLAKAYWDLGLSYEYAGEYEQATQTVRKAYDLSQDKAMLQELDAIARLREESPRAAAAGAAPEVASGK
ncbi:MAG: tetratricopeptide repeat protein [Deltaproteobacteria bacterium]|nr:MAG: tetratricopeptide repeat protein [Deltaproteobacteria bacterium]